MLRLMWRAASKPRLFFQALDNSQPRIAPALGVAVFSYLLAIVGLALAFIRISNSNAFLPILLMSALFAVIHIFTLWGLGGMIVQILGQLELRSWELVGWAWTPLFFVTVSLLPATIFAPMLAAVTGIILAIIWHLVVFATGLRVFVPKRGLRIMVVYVLLVFAAPLLFAVFILSVFS